MAKLDVVDIRKNKVKQLDVSDDVFAAPMNTSLLWEVVRWQQAKKREGNASTKTRANVSGTTKKPYAQKHTGRARQGDIKSPLQVGGGRAFGPHPRSYDYRLNRKVRQGALKVALSQLVRENCIVVVDGWSVEKPRTKDALAALSTLGVERALVVDVDNPALKKSVANAIAYKYLSQMGVNVYDVLKFGKMVITVPALQAIEARLGGSKGGDNG